MNERERRIARARLLRRDGKTYAEIRAVIGPVDDSTLLIWCKGIARPPSTFRSWPKTSARREAGRLRAAGHTYDEIAEKLNVSKGSLSLWLRGRPGPGRKPYDNKEHLAKIQPLGARGRRNRAAAKRASLRTAAAASLSDLTPRELFIAGIALYWAEGSKDKAWRRSGRVVLINSDADVIAMFLRWLDLLGVPVADRRYRLNIHETADVRKHERWWAERLGIDVAQFARATLKRHNPKTVRLNTGEDYHGCLVISVARSGWLYYSIEGWWASLICSTDVLAADGRLTGAVPSAVGKLVIPSDFDSEVPGSSPGSGA